MRPRVVYLEDEIRQRHRLAEFLRAASACRRDVGRSFVFHGPDGSALHSLRRTFGTRFRRRSEADGPALLHQRSCTTIQTGRERLRNFVADRLCASLKIAVLRSSRIVLACVFLVEAAQAAFARDVVVVNEGTKGIHVQLRQPIKGVMLVVRYADIGPEAEKTFSVGNAKTEVHISANWCGTFFNRELKETNSHVILSRKCTVSVR
jgi:hypothetical protein